LTNINTADHAMSWATVTRKTDTNRAK